MGLPPFDRKTKVKLGVCLTGITISYPALVGALFFQFFFYRFEPDLFEGMSGELGPLREIRFQGLVCSIIAAVSSAVFTLCIIWARSLTRERRRQIKEIKAAMKAEGKKWPWW